MQRGVVQLVKVAARRAGRHPDIVGLTRAADEDHRTIAAAAVPVRMQQHFTPVESRLRCLPRLRRLRVRVGAP